MTYYTHYIVLPLLALLLPQNIALMAQEDARPPEFTRLETFIGTWQGTGTYNDGKSATAFSMTMNGRPAAGGAAIHLEIGADVPNSGKYHEEDFLAWDALRKTVTLFAVSNMGEVAAYTGAWVEGKTNTLKLQEIKTVDNQEYRTDVTIIIRDGNTFSWDVVMESPDGVQTFNSEFTRK
jgi:hypothetical protein